MARQERNNGGNRSAADTGRGRSSTMLEAMKPSADPRSHSGNLAYSMEDVSVLGQQALMDNQTSAVSPDVVMPYNVHSYHSL